MRPTPLAFLAAGLMLLGCPPPPQPPPGDEDAGELPVEDAGVDAGQPDAGEPCVKAVTGMVITQTTRLCPGVLEADVAAGDPAVVVDGDDVTLTCDRTVLVGRVFGTTEKPTVGILVKARRNVVLRGCDVRSFRYGVMAVGSTGLTLEDMKLDDNFTDPAAGWVQDSVQGGGLRLEDVDGGTVVRTSLRRNWNGVELRGTRGVTIRGTKADHCSNTGATLVESHENEISDSDMSWGIRGSNLSYPNRWYGVDTRDSAGIIIDSSSSKNRILRNDFRYGGDGVFIRAVIGPCAEDNLVVGNETSFSPHNAIECWCDGNQFIDNVASDSHYGVWLGGTDRGVVRGNKVERNWVDGISIQIGEDRHTVIENNLIQGNGFENKAKYGWRYGAGLLLTGREYQAWDPLSRRSPELANSGHLLVQNNTFGNNAAGDLFVSDTRGLVLASNCGANGAAPTLTQGPETDAVVQVGACGQAQGRSAPTASLSGPGMAPLGTPVVYDATASQASDAGGTLGYVWVAQPSGMRFSPARLPPLAFFAPDGGASQPMSFAAPGAYDVMLTVHDGRLGALAHRQVAVLPSGQKLDDAAARWRGACQAKPDCAVNLGNEAGLDGVALKVTSDAPFDFALATPPNRDLNLDLSAPNAKLAFFVRARNPNENGGWQVKSPVVVLRNTSGGVWLEPSANLLPTNPAEWAYVEVPLSGQLPDGGASGWKQTVDGGSLAKVDWLELHTDTWGWRPFDLWIDALVVDPGSWPDGGLTDAGQPDGGLTDAGQPDGGPTDAGTGDAGVDAGTGVQDAGTADGGDAG